LHTKDPPSFYFFMETMKNYLVLFTKSVALSMTDRSWERGLCEQYQLKYEGTYLLGGTHSCHIFAIEGQFSLNLFSKNCGELTADQAVGLLDEDELSWVLSTDLAA